MAIQTKQVISIIMLLFLPIQLIAQDEPDFEGQSRMEQLVEKAENEEAETAIDLETIKNKVRINECDSLELAGLQLLSTTQIAQFLLYRKRLGPIVSIYELQAIPGWDVAMIQKLVPFISLDTKGLVSNAIMDRLKSGDQLAFVKMSRVLQKSTGFVDSSGFVGGRNIFQFRYSFNHKNLLQWGVAGGNQAGEPVRFSAGRPGFDQLSVHAFARQLGKIQLLAIGDFRVNFGQGLICWQGMGFSKSAEVLAIKREAPIFQPSTTGAVSGFFRGGGIAFKWSSVDVSAFTALNRKDANIEFDTARSILTSGLRRTENELSHRNNLSVATLGIRAGISRRLYSFHLNAIGSKWNHVFAKKSLPYNLYAPSGNVFMNCSIDYAATVSNIHFFGEVAANERNKFAVVSAALISLDKRTNIALLYRRISPAYFAWNGNAFTDGSYCVNENGLYYGIQFQLSKKIQLAGYYDIYSFPWLKFRVDFPSHGSSVLAQFKYTPDKTSEFYIRFRKAIKQENEEGSVSNAMIERKQSYFRIHYLSQLTSRLVLQFRLEETWNSNKNEGILLYAEMQKKIPGYGVKLNFRLQYTDTDNYDSRIYAYESDMPYSFSITPQYGQFIKYYLVNSFNLKKLSKQLPAVVISMKWSQRFLISGESFGSGLNLIPGRRQTIISLQLSYSEHG
jgi:hypothetical protein